MGDALRVIDMKSDFTRYPAGRYVLDGPFSGQRFREEFLLPAVRDRKPVQVAMDSGLGYGSSFLEEAFGGLVREGYSPEQIEEFVQVISKDDSLKDEIRDYMRAAAGV